ncbi:hypothetical protein [Nocardia sp. NPDC004260]
MTATPLDPSIPPAEGTRTASGRGAAVGDLGPMLRLVTADPAEDGSPTAAVDAYAAAADAYAAAADAENTVRAYASAWQRFVVWCESNGYTALPADPRTVAAYLAAAADDPDGPAAVSTLVVARSAIGHFHTEARLPDPTADTFVRRVMRGIRRTRTKGGKTARQAPAATLPVIQAVVTTAHTEARTWRQAVAARRDIALTVVLYAAALRRSEAVGLSLGDLTVVDGPDNDQRLRIRLRGSKTSQTDVEYLYLKRGSGDALWCPWCALQRWLAVLAVADDAVITTRRRLRAANRIDEDAVTDAASIAVQRHLRRDTSDPHEHRCAGPWPAPHRAADAPVFRPVSHGGLPHFDTALSDRSVGRILADRSAAAGVEPLRGHSPRAGVATHLWDTGATVAEVMALTRHKRVETALLYDRRRAQRSADVDTGL